VIVHDEFDGAGVGIMCGLGDFSRRLADFVAQFAEFILEQWRRRFFDKFLIAALNGTITFAQMNNAAFLVAENLNFDMMRILDVFLKYRPRNLPNAFFRFGSPV